MLDKKVISLINKELPKFSFPSISKFQIDNKIKVLFIEDKTQPLVSLKLLVKTGAFNDSLNGISYFSMQMAKRGSKNRNSSDIAEEFEQMGTGISFGANWHSSIMSLITLPDFLDKSLEILSDCFFNSTFDENEIKKLKVMHLADIEQEMADPSYLAGLLFNKNMYRNYPYGSPIIGDKNSIELIQQNNCVEFHNNLIAQPEYIVIIAGNISRDKARELIALHFHQKDFKGNKKTYNTENDIPKSKGNRIIIKNKNDANQTVFRIGKFTIRKEHKDYPALQFANTIIGGYFNSRLNKILREELGYTYGVHSLINSMRFASTLEISTGVKKEASQDTVVKIFEELNKLSDNQVPDEEFHTAKQYILGSFVRSWETPQQISSMIHSIIASDLPFDYYDNFYKKISEITVDELYKIQKKYFKPEDILISAVGDEELLSKTLHQFGDISVQ